MHLVNRQTLSSEKLHRKFHVSNCQQGLAVVPGSRNIVPSQPHNQDPLSGSCDVPIQMADLGKSRLNSKDRKIVQEAFLKAPDRLILGQLRCLADLAAFERWKGAPQQQLSTPKSQRFLRFAIAMPIA